MKCCAHCVIECSGVPTTATVGSMPAFQKSNLVLNASLMQCCSAVAVSRSCTDAQ